MGLTDRIKSALVPQSSRSQWPTLTWDQYAELVSFGGNQYAVPAFSQTIKGHVEEIDGSYAGLVDQAYKSNAVVFAVMLARRQLFSEARFQWQELRNGRPGKLFSNADLSVLETPWPNGNTADLLSRMIDDADLGGNFFGVRRDRNTIRRLRPDWVDIILGSPNDPEVEAGDIDAEVLGYIYRPGGRNSGKPAIGLLRQEVAHWAPIPDPLAWFRGMSWLTPVLREIIADKQMTDHKSAFLINGATPNLTVAIDKDLKEAANPAAFAEWVEAFKKANPTGNQWDKFKTWYLAGGTQVTKVGTDMQEADFKNVQGAGETRIAAAGGVPPVIVGLSEGLQAATYSNYGQARRRFADNTMRPLWRGAAGALQDIVPPPNSSSRLWYDDRDIQALAEDKKDLAEVRQFEAQQIGRLLDAGFNADDVIEAVTSGDFTRLKGNHSGLFSVQLQPPMPDGPPKPAVPQIPATTNGVAKRDEMLLDVMRIAATRQPPDVRMVIEAGAFQIAAPEVHPPDVRFEAGAITTPEVHVDATTTIEAGAVVVNTPDVTVENTVEPTPIEVSVENTVEPTPIEVRNEVTVEPTPVTVTNSVESPDVIVNVPEPRSVTKTIERNAKGEITAITETPDGD